MARNGLSGWGKDKIINRDLNIGYEKDTIYASVAISGSLPTKEDITVTIEEFPSGIESYNQKELGSDDIKYRTLTNGIYSFPQENVVVKRVKPMARILFTLTHPLCI